MSLLHFEVPSFGSVAAELFEQQLLWDDGPKPEETAFELFGAAVNDVRKRRTESNRFDPPMLRRISSYRRILARGLERIGMPDTTLAEHAEIDVATVNAATELSAATPHARRVRVAGRLDLMGKSQSVLKLHLPGNAIVTALWEGEQPVESLHSFFNREVVIEGAGFFDLRARCCASMRMPSRLQVRRTIFSGPSRKRPLSGTIASWLACGQVSRRFMPAFSEAYQQKSRTKSLLRL